MRLEIGESGQSKLTGNKEYTCSHTIPNFDIPKHLVKKYVFSPTKVVLLMRTSISGQRFHNKSQVF